MKRYRAYDPPEYLDWQPSPELVDGFAARLREDPYRKTVIDGLSAEDLVALYRDLLRTRLHDIGLKRWVRQGVISKAWLGTGEEAVTVGAVAALHPDRDVVMPMIRNAGACIMMGIPVADLFRAYLATADAPGGGRDLHVGDPERGVYQPISHMGTNVPVMAGVALSFRNRREDRVALTWVGDGASRTGECHEGANLAAVQNLPVIFVLQSNQVALGTRTQQHTAGAMAAWPDMYGIPKFLCDGNNVLDMLAATHLARERCRLGEGPVAIVAETFRMGGHATHDEREARETFPAALFTHWGQRDPVGLYEEYLVRHGIQRGVLDEVEREVTAEVDRAAEEALASKERIPVGTGALYAGFSRGDVLEPLRQRPVAAHPRER